MISRAWVAGPLHLSRSQHSQGATNLYFGLDRADVIPKEGGRLQGKRRPREPDLGPEVTRIAQVCRFRGFQTATAAMARAPILTFATHGQAGLSGEGAETGTVN